MQIDHHHETIEACRFCFMCRHLSPVGNVTYRESDTPRGRALIADKLRRDFSLLNTDFVETFYRAELSGANRTHCFSHYDEVGLVLAVRRDIVAAGRAPLPVQLLADELKLVEFRLEGEGDILYYLDPYGSPENIPHGCMTITGGDSGKALEVLGYFDEAAAVLARFREAVMASGCKTLVTSCPAAYDHLVDRLDGIAVRHSSQFLQPVSSSGRVFYLESDFLRNYRNHFSGPRDSLTRCDFEIVPFGITEEESMGAGEGAIVYDRLYPELCARLCERIAALTDDPANDLLVVASPFTKHALGRFTPQLRVHLLDEVITGRI